MNQTWENGEKPNFANLPGLEALQQLTLVFCQ